MQSPVHFIIGAAICRHTRCKPVGLTLAFASHYILDALPHFEDAGLLCGMPGRAVAAAWPWVLRALIIAVIPLAGAVHALVRRACPVQGLAIHVVAGGFIACSPDLMGLIFGGASCFGRANLLAHMVWVPTYRDIAVQYPALRPLVALACLLAESMLFAVGLRQLRRPGAVDPAVEPPDDLTIPIVRRSA